MYRKQMILQRVTSYLLLGAAVLVFIYSLGIMTDLYESFYFLSSPTFKEGHRNYVEGVSIYRTMQTFNQELTTAGIVLILSSVALFVFRSHDRRKYYIANYITIGANAVANVYVSYWALTNVFAYKQQFYNVDFEKLAKVAKNYKIEYTESTFWFDASLFVFIPLLLVTALSIGNLIWKIVLMNAEKKLIIEGQEA